MEHRIDYVDIRLVDVILSSRPPLILTNIASKLGLNKETLYRRITRVRKLGFKFTVDVNLAKIGLGCAIILLEEPSPVKPVKNLKAKMSLLPRGELLAYYLPYGSGLEEIVDLLGRRRVEEYFEATIILGSKPSLLDYYDYDRGVLSLDLDILYNNITRGDLERTAMDQHLISSKTPLSELDIRILSALEEDALQTPQQIARKIGVKQSRIHRRLRNLSKYMFSYSLTETPWSISKPLISVALLEAREDKDILAIASAFHHHPLVRSIYVNPYLNKALIVMSANSETITNQYYLLQQLVDDKILEKYKTWITTRQLTTTSTLDRVAYSKYTHRWLEIENKENLVLEKN